MLVCVSIREFKLVAKAVDDNEPVLSYLVIIFNRGNVRTYMNPAEYKETNCKLNLTTSVILQLP